MAKSKPNKTQKSRRPGQMRKHILITNDDGYSTDGIKSLIRRVKKTDHIHTVVAPEKSASGSSRSLSLYQPVYIRKVSRDMYAVKGTPTDCIMMALYELFHSPPRPWRKIEARKGIPEIIISGINHGQNLGDDVSYSGTCAAAAEAAMHGIPGVALSMRAGPDYTFNFDGAADIFVRCILPRIIVKPMKRWTYLNINFPPVPPEKIKGIKVVPLGRNTYHNVISRARDTKRGGHYYKIAGNHNIIKYRGTDMEAVAKGYIAISPVHLRLTGWDLIPKYKKEFESLTL